MRKGKIMKFAQCLLGSLILAGILAAAGDLAAAWQGIEVKCSLFLLAAAILTVLFFVKFRKKPRKALKAVLWLTASIAVVAAALFLCWKTFSSTAAFEAVDNGKRQIYADHKVMMIVPHQDDDINVLGGVMEEYARYGSELYPVFVTNGDQMGLAEERFREALDVFAYIGVPEENVIFLGYGDTWQEGGPHLYNAPSGTVLTSAYGATETYGTQAKGVWREGADYTVENLLEDIQDVILTIRPDVIYCSDYDIHIDHKATTLAFEKVMGRILREDPQYRPLVFKGYAYNTAWYAQPDFYEVNLLSAQNVFADPYGQTPCIYRWEERLRLPVGDYTLSRSLFTSGIYHTLDLYTSQEANFQAARIINSDKVVWYRDTNSLCYDAEITVSSGNGGLLSDFMLIENLDLTDEVREPLDGVWIPDDGEKTALITFPEERDICLIRLYDNPDPEHNVLAGIIRFDDGSEVHFDHLDPGGAATVIRTEKTGASGFSVILTKTEGENAGLTEVEAFGQTPEHGFRFVKLMDRQENFIYDYWLPEGVEDQLAVYSVGLTGEEKQNLSLRWDNQKCWAEYENGKLKVIVPEGKTMTLTVSVEGTDLSDTVRIHNPGKLLRWWCTLAQTLEEAVFQKYCDGAHRKSATYKLLYAVLELVR